MSQVIVKKIVQDEEFIGLCNTTSSINCDNISDAPRVGWLKFNGGPIEQEIVFQDPLESSAIKGVWVGEKGRGILVDGTVADFVAKCNNCCGTNKTVDPVYNGVYPDAIAPVQKEFTVQRADDGTQWDTEKIGLDYLKSVIPTTLYRSSRDNTSGVTTYKFKSYKKDVGPQVNYAGVTDTITETPLTFDSNVPAALSGGQKYQFVLKVNGLVVGVPTPLENATSLAALNTALNANATYNTYGTYTVSAGAIRLSSTTVENATLTITVAAV